MTGIDYCSAYFIFVSVRCWVSTREEGSSIAIEELYSSMTHFPILSIFFVFVM